MKLGLRANLGQFSLLVGVNALVGAMVGQERAVLPLLARREFGLSTVTAVLTFILAFGLVKPVANLLAGSLADRFGRKPVLVAGWLVGVPVPFLVIWAPSWGWVVFANALLGLNQGLTWSTTVIMKTDLVGARRRGLAMGLNEASGYGAVALAALATGYLAARYGLRPEPFYLGIAVAGAGLGLSTVAVRETIGHARHEAAAAPEAGWTPGRASGRQLFWHTSVREPALSACCQAGLVNNLNDALAWGAFPLLFASGGQSVEAIGVLTATYPAVWAVGQLASGALSDVVGRKWLIVGGMSVQAAALGLVAAVTGFAPWLVGAILLGVGTAMVYPALLAAVGDVAHPSWRASALGVYRLWRDLGFAAGAVVAGATADALGLRAAVWIVAGLSLASGLVVMARMYETLRPEASSVR